LPFLPPPHPPDLHRTRRRAGKLEDADKHLAAAEAAVAAAGGAPDREAGLLFCHGLRARYASTPREALAHLNAARKDPAWAARALTQMVEICLDPDEDVAWADDCDEDADGLARGASTSGDGGRGASAGGGLSRGASAAGSLGGGSFVAGGALSRGVSMAGGGGRGASAGGALSRAVSAAGGGLSRGGSTTGSTTGASRDGGDAAGTARALLQQLRPADVEPTKYKVRLVVSLFVCVEGTRTLVVARPPERLEALAGWRKGKRVCNPHPRPGRCSRRTRAWPASSGQTQRPRLAACLSSPRPTPTTCPCCWRSRTASCC
jgi:hypothetical protein